MGTCNSGLPGINTLNTIGCLPCSHKYLTATYLNNHSSLLDSDFHDFLTKNLGSNSLCKGLGCNINKIGLSELNRHLIGEGSHRHLVSAVQFDMQSDALSWLDEHFYEVIIIERLPTGVFADPFELQHLVERGGMWIHCLRKLFSLICHF